MGDRSSAPVLCEVRALRRVLGPRFALEIETFLLRRGEKVAVVGTNGAGKTTLLRVLAGLDAPTSVERGVSAWRGTLSEDAAAPVTTFAFLRQQPYLFHGSVARNLAYPLRMRRTPASEIAARVAETLELLDLRPLAAAPVGRLSGGEQKRVALGRALIARPEVLFLDEPDTHLDVHSLEVITRVLETTVATILLTTHDLRFAHRIGDRIVHLRDGKVVPGLPSNVLSGRAAGERFVSRAGLEVRLGRTVPEGTTKIALDPRSLVLSREPLASSMLNQLRGRVAAVREQGGNVWLEIDCGEPLTAIVSHDSYARLELNLGREVCVSFKANAVEVL
jgi:molybdopterin-binding protein